MLWTGGLEIKKKGKIEDVTHTKILILNSECILKEQTVGTFLWMYQRIKCYYWVASDWP